MNTAFIVNPQTPAILLRIGLAIVLFYAAVASLLEPEDWIGYLPDAVTSVVNGEILLKFFSLYQLMLVVWLVSGVYLHIAGLVCAATFVGIISANFSLLEIVFRDIALVFASLALVSLSWPRKK